LRDAQVGHVHEQADEEEQRGNRRAYGDQQERQRRRRSRGGIGAGRRRPSEGLRPGRRVFGRDRLRRGDGRQAVQIRPVPVPEDQGAARGRLRRVRVPGTRRVAELRHVVPVRQRLGVR